MSGLPFDCVQLLSQASSCLILELFNLSEHLSNSVAYPLLGVWIGIFPVGNQLIQLGEHSLDERDRHPVLSEGVGIEYSSVVAHQLEVREKVVIVLVTEGGYLI